MKRYATGCAFNTSEMLMNFPYKKLQITCKDCQRINGNNHRNFLVQKVFRKALEMIFEDIIDNNVRFELPIKGSYIHIKPCKGADFSAARRNGKYKDIDFLKSYFTGYDMKLEMPNTKIARSKNIYLSGRLRQKLIDNINSGKNYC